MALSTSQGFNNTRREQLLSGLNVLVYAALHLDNTAFRIAYTLNV